jgi:Pentapeptide repeats (9 copies)
VPALLPTRVVTNRLQTIVFRGMFAIAPDDCVFCQPRAIGGILSRTHRGDAAMNMHGVKHCLNVKKSDLAGSTFDDVNFAGATFENVMMSGWSVHNVNLSGLRLDNANVSGARISNANLAGTSVTDSRLEGMTINGIPVTDLLAAYAAAKSQAA